MNKQARWSVVGAVVSLVAIAVAVVGQAPAKGDRAMYERLFREGNFQEAYAGLQSLCVDPATPFAEVPSALDMAVNCLHQLGRINEVNALLESAVAAHAKTGDCWRRPPDTISRCLTRAS